MIPKYSARHVGFAHFSRDPYDLPLAGAPINEIAHKYRFSGVMSEYTLRFGISKFM
jgi:hypothetical protein